MVWNIPLSLFIIVLRRKCIYLPVLCTSANVWNDFIFPKNKNSSAKFAILQFQQYGSTVSFEEFPENSIYGIDFPPFREKLCWLCAPFVTINHQLESCTSTRYCRLREKSWKVVHSISTSLHPLWCGQHSTVCKSPIIHWDVNTWLVVLCYAQTIAIQGVGTCNEGGVC